jgi:hypothetical protein
LAKNFQVRGKTACHEQKGALATGRYSFSLFTSSLKLIAVTQ